MSALSCFKCGRGMEDMVSLHRISAPGTKPSVWACTEHATGTDSEPDRFTRELMEDLQKPFPATGKDGQ